MPFEDEGSFLPNFPERSVLSCCPKGPAAVGLRQTELTGPSWPLQTCRSELATSQGRSSSLSNPTPSAHRRLRQTDVTHPYGPRTMRRHSPLAASQSRRVLSSLPGTSIRWRWGATESRNPVSAKVCRFSPVSRSNSRGRHPSRRQAPAAVGPQADGSDTAALPSMVRRHRPFSISQTAGSCPNCRTTRGFRQN